MSDSPIYLSQCAACTSPLVDEINRRMKAGIPTTAISAWLGESGQYLSRNALGRHKTKHLMDRVQQERMRQKTALERQSKTLKPVAVSDLAALVEQNVIAGIESGTLIPTVSEGLRAQEIRERRLEKGADRALALRVAAVLSGAYVEGDFREVDDADYREEPPLLGTGA